MGPMGGRSARGLFPRGYHTGLARDRLPREEKLHSIPFPQRRPLRAPATALRLSGVPSSTVNTSLHLPVFCCAFLPLLLFLFAPIVLSLLTIRFLDCELLGAETYLSCCAFCIAVSL